jgi:serine/threonine protein kinase, bacterial
MLTGQGAGSIRLLGRPTQKEGYAVSAAVALTTGMEPYPGYRLRQVLGRGGFAEVWEAETAGGASVALKFMRCDDGLAASKEIRSIESMRQIHHANLIRIDAVWCLPGYIVIAMELADGSLLDLLDAYQSEFNSAIAPEQVCLHLIQAAEAIDFMNKRQHVLDGHRVAFQHCDIKPSNLLLFGETVKVADLSLATPTSAPIKVTSWAGTVDYTAPEVFHGRLSDWSDQYALAVTYCQMRGGRLPFPSTPQSFPRVNARPAPDLTMLAERERSIIRRALGEVPQHRWPSCSEMMAQLSRAVLPERAAARR